MIGGTGRLNILAPRAPGCPPVWRGELPVPGPQNGCGGEGQPKVETLRSLIAFLRAASSAKRFSSRRRFSSASFFSRISSSR